MKKFKILLAVALVVCTMFTCVFADDSFIVNNIVYSGTGNIDVSFSTSYGAGYDLVCSAKFDTAKFTLVSVSNEADMKWSKRKKQINIGTKTETSNQVYTFTLAPIAGADVNGATIEFINIQIDYNGSNIYGGVGTNKTITITTDTPVVNKYNVTFTGYESENRTDVEENTEITLPAAPAVDKNKEFVGWSDGTTTYEAGAKYTVTKEVTFTAVINDITLPTPVVTKEGIISAEVDGKTYTDIFEGIYTLTPGKASLTKFGVKIPGKINPADVREFATSGTFEGEGTFVYRVALFGVMDKADIAATPFAE